uniref:Enoyl reductase (ER) domain-containing protein n=2 Tax=Pseudo-nitzschia australis TaxID=44445 RepID=A0A7S4AIU6_9STRA|mmetsp:Transcript_25634/g.56206  ORF Transcript_25634/g.56206 Transcript_25634/m.56206 type:complete len:379 (-) Transcript_25634:130-1266(-)
MMRKHSTIFFLLLGKVLALTNLGGTMDKAVQKVPEKFRALVAASAGNSFSDVATVIEIETPELREDEALIRVAYAGVNGGCETFRARGEHSFQGNKDVKNFRLGAEGVGHVVAVGSEVNNVAVGDAVCFVGSAFSEYTTSKASMLWVVPEATPEYVGLRISALTSCAMLEQTGNIQQGEKILITAAAGGAGHFAVQFAKLAGCEVIGTCGSDEKAQLLKELGCDHVINYKNQDVKVELNRIAPDGLDVVLEGVGGIMLKTALECLGPEGRLLQIGYISEYPHNEGEIEDSNPDINVAELFWKSQTIHKGKQIIYGNAWPKDFSLVAGCKKRVLDVFAEKKIQSIVDKSPEFVGLESVNDAINHMLSGKTIGKVVVKIS